MAEEGEKEKGGKLKLIIIFVLLLAVLGGGGFVAWKFSWHNLPMNPRVPQILQRTNLLLRLHRKSWSQHRWLHWNRLW